MFTGIIQEIGRVQSAILARGNLVFDIEAKQITPKLGVGASVSINGACQTVIICQGDHFKVEAVRETLSRTNLGSLKSGSLVNLELPVGLKDLLHGHLVQGHVDCQASITEIKLIEGSTLLSFEYPGQYDNYVIPKGSIAVDGVSLTIVEVSLGKCQVSLIPHTIESTTFRSKKVGDKVNLEFDMIAKYIEKMVSPSQNKITADFLKEHGF
jgi:riboflavin synthase